MTSEQPGSFGAAEGVAQLPKGAVAGQYKLSRPITVRVTIEPAYVTVHFRDLDIAGRGALTSDAMKDLLDSMQAYLTSLESREQKLAPELQQDLATLRDLLVT